MRPKVCVVCGDALAIGTRADHRYCGVNCRVRAHHLRRGVGTRQARNDRRARLLEATVERLKRERDTAVAEVERVRSAATTTSRMPTASSAPQNGGAKIPVSVPTEDRLRESLRIARASNSEKDRLIAELQECIQSHRDTIALMQPAQSSNRREPSPRQDLAQLLRVLEQQVDDLSAENNRLKTRNSALQAALERVPEETGQAVQRAKQEAAEAFRIERSQNALLRKQADERAQSAEETLRRDRSLLKTVGTVIAGLVAANAQAMEAEQLAAEGKRSASDETSPEEQRATSGSPASAASTSIAKPLLSNPAADRAPPADDHAAWDALRRGALRQRWLPISDMCVRSMRSELQAESAFALKQAALGQATTARRLASGDDGDRQIEIAALQARWSFIERPPPGWRKPIRWEKGRYRLDTQSELEIQRLSADRRREWERKLRD